MTQNRVRIVDVADALGLSTATISNVIHGKTEKISDETVKRVQQELERSGYIPNMAGILLARNNSRIIGVVVNDHEKYEGRVLEDGFVMSSLNALSHKVNEKGYFLMIKTTSDISEIPVFASMWNMDGLILMGFCDHIQFLEQLGDQALLLCRQSVEQMLRLQCIMLILHGQLLGCLQSLKGLLGILIGIHKVKPPFIPEGLF